LVGSKKLLADQSGQAREVQRKQRKRDDEGYLLETVGETRTDIRR